MKLISICTKYTKNTIIYFTNKDKMMKKGRKNMRNLKKWTALGLVAVMSVTTFAGCGNNGGNNGGGDSGELGGELNVAIWDGGQQAGLQQILDDFTAETGVKTNLQVITWDSYWTLLEAGASGGDMPDVFWMHSNEAVKYMSNGILLDITDQVNSSEVLEMDKFPEDLKEMYQYDGKTYALPKDMDTVAIWYNKTMFDEAGIPYPDGSWTWDDFYEIAKQLTKDDGSQYGFAANPSNEQDTWMNIIYTMGGCVLNEEGKSGFDDPKTIEAMEFVDKLIKEVMPPASTMSETGTDVLFNSGKVAMISQGSWMVAPFKENEYIVEHADVARLPKDSETGRSISIYNGLGWAASAETDNPTAAYKLIEWFATKEMQQKQAELGVTMAAYKGVSDAWVNSTTEFNLQPYLDAMEDTVFRPATKSTLAWWNPMVEEFKKVWNGEEEMVTACENVTTMMNEKIAEEAQ